MCICVLITTVIPAKMAETIDLPFGEADSGGPKKLCNGMDRNTYERHLTNTIKRTIQRIHAQRRRGLSLFTIITLATC